MVEFFSADGYLKNPRYWQEPKFMADKQQALATFQQNESLLAQIVGKGLYNHAFSRFVPTIQSWHENCLCLDPSEIMQDDETDFIISRKILTLAAETKPDLEALREALRCHSRLEYESEDDLTLNVFGYTYDTFSNAYFGKAILP